MSIQQMFLGTPLASAGGGSQLLLAYSGDYTEYYSETGGSYGGLEIHGDPNSGDGSVSQDKVITGHNGCPFAGN